MTLFEIEELIKNVNHKAIKAMLRNAAVLGDENASEEMKSQALENVKAIAANKKSINKRKIKQVELTQPVQQPSATPAIAQSSVIEYPKGLHLTALNTGAHDESNMKNIFNALPDHEKKAIVDWHSNIKMKKSIDSLHDLFVRLKKHL